MQLAFDGASGTVELGRDFCGGMSLHLQDCDAAEVIVAGDVESFEESLEVFRKFDRENGIGFATEDFAEGDGREIARTVCREGVVSGASPFLTVLGANQIDGFVSGDGHEEGPEAVAVKEFGEAAFSDPQAKAFEGGEGNVFFVCEGAGGTFQFAASELDHPLKVGLPKTLRRLRISRTELFDPERDGIHGGHAKSGNFFVASRGRKASYFRTGPS